MSGQEEVKRMIHSAWEEKGGMREELRNDIRIELRSMLFKGLVIFGTTMLGAGIALTVYLANIRSDLDQLQKENESRFSQEAAQLLQLQIEQNKTLFQEVSTTIKSIDERLRNNGI